MSTPVVENYPAIIGGERLEVAATLEVINPSTGQPFAAVARCGSDEID